MPNDGISEIPVPDQGQPQPKGQSVMDELLTKQLAQSGIIAQNNFITVQKVVDYDYLENKRIVTLDEAVGVREVQSAQNPGGPAPRTL